MSNENIIQRLKEKKNIFLQTKAEFVANRTSIQGMLKEIL